MAVEKLGDDITIISGSEALEARYQALKNLKPGKMFYFLIDGGAGSEVAEAEARIGLDVRRTKVVSTVTTKGPDGMAISPNDELERMRQGIRLYYGADKLTVYRLEKL